MNKFYVYVYVYCNPLKPGSYSYMENGIGIDFPCAPFYIGKGKDLRLDSHLKEAKKYYDIIEEETIKEEKLKYNRHKINTINQIQREGEEIIIYKICEKLEEETSYLLERFFIKLIGRKDKKLGILTNMTDGGEGVSGAIMPTPWNKGLTKDDNISILMIGINTSNSLIEYYKNGGSHWSRGKIGVFSNETLKIMSDKKLGKSSPRKGQKNSEESKKKCSDSHKGIKQSKITIQKRSEAMKISLKNKNLMSVNPISQYSLQGDFIKTYQNCYIAEQESGISAKIIRSQARSNKQNIKRQKERRKFIWVYVTDLKDKIEEKWLQIPDISFIHMC